MKMRYLSAAALVVSVFGLLIAGSELVAEPVKYVKPPESVRFKPGPNSAKAIAHCTMCHSADYVSTQPPLPRATWKAIVVKMQKVHGAPIPEAEVEPIVEYLVKAYGRE